MAGHLHNDDDMLLRMDTSDIGRSELRNPMPGGRTGASREAGREGQWQEVPCHGAETQ